jgi:hypothetical protein
MRKILRKANLILTKVKKKMGPKQNSESLLFTEIRSEQEGFQELGKNMSLQSILTALEECSINMTRGIART